jgi:hypothetical protein
MSIRPGAAEVCNGADENCDGANDEGLTIACWTDGDGDGYALTGAMGRCQPSGGCPAGTTSRNPSTAANRDCHDGNASVRPGGTETCNNVDEDCDTTIDEGVTRSCMTACGSGTETCSAGTFAGCTARTPMPEVCNGMDDDCVGGVDNGLPVGCWADPDGDGFAASGAAGQCAPTSVDCPPGTTSLDPGSASNRDCLEGNAGVNPGETEACDGIDNNCDGSVSGECGTGCQAASNGGRFYVFCNRTNRDYGEAAADCSAIGTLSGSMGMDLASIGSASEQSFLTTSTQAIASGEWWIGLFRTAGMSGTWVWEDGSAAPQTSGTAPPPYNNWEVGEPNGSGNCARLRASGMWADLSCNDDLRYVCEGPIP